MQAGFDPIDVDILIIGAGISGIGMAKHLQDAFPERRFLILDKRQNFGGTWDFHQYPGIRSDSDLFTFGYSFKPWSGAPVADAPLIMTYLQDVIAENNLADRICYGKEVLSASWSSADQKWFLTVKDVATAGEQVYSCRILNMCQGYYDYDNPHKPVWPGMADFGGDIMHPMEWDVDYDYRDKKIVVIGSGATAATIVPQLAKKADHVTMLQRSPTWFYAAPNQNIVHNILSALRLPKGFVHAATRWFVLALGQWLHHMAKHKPEKAKRMMLKELGKYLPEDQIKAHFTPAYRPWQQRIAFIPDGDFFAAIKNGSASVHTGHISHFDKAGIVLDSGQKLAADLVVTATGFDLLLLGGIPFDIDGKAVDFSTRFTHRGAMMEGMPNLFYFFGYLRSSWTMRVDLLAGYQKRILQHMDEKGAKSVTPTRTADQQDLPAHAMIEPEEFNPGYIMRSIDKLPRNARQYPWTFDADYYVERKTFPAFDLDDPTLIYR